MGISNLYRKLGRIILPGREGASALGAPPMKLTETQRMFLIWNANRLGITAQECERRYAASWSALDGGHSGLKFRSYNNLSYDLFQVFCSDTKNEIYDAYLMHAPMHFLRMLSYREPAWSEQDVMVRKLLELPQVNILDYGCGLAQRSRSLATYLMKQGVVVNLHLADIPTIRKNFLIWLGQKTGIPISFLECTSEKPIPDLPPCDLVFAIDFFEHVHDPVLYFEKFHRCLKGGGLIEADVADHEDGFMHISPKLGELRGKILSHGYQEILSNRLYQKKE